MIPGMRATPTESFSFVYSCDLQTNVQVKVAEFEGIFRDVLNPVRRLNQLFAEITVKISFVQNFKTIEIKKNGCVNVLNIITIKKKTFLSHKIRVKFE